MDILTIHNKSMCINIPILGIFSCASTKVERNLSSLSCVCVYADQNKGTPPPKWHFYWEFLDFKSGFGFTTKINLEWYLFLNGSLQITLLQIYFWYYKTIWDHFKHGGIFFSKPPQTTQLIRMQAQQKILPPTGQKGHSFNENAWKQYHMQQKQSECKPSRHTQPLNQSTSSRSRHNKNHVLPKCSTMLKSIPCLFSFYLI